MRHMGIAPSPEASIGLGIPTRWAGSTRNVRHPSGFLFAAFRILSASMTLSPSTVYGASFGLPHSPWLRPLAPSAPQGVAARCSQVSQLLWPHLTSSDRTSQYLDFSFYVAAPLDSGAI